MVIKKIFEIEKKPQKGLMIFEWVVMGYALVTLLFIFFTYTKSVHPEAMIFARVRLVALTLAMWLVYRFLPCRFTKLARVALQLILLAEWYPDTYELNRVLPNLDHVFASAEQSLMGFQPALVFHQAMPWPWFSELMDMSYVSYYPLMALVILFYFFYRYNDFEKASVVLVSSFFIYYLIFDFIPVTGPQFYYKVAGLDNIAHGIFPNVHDYFYSHQDVLVSPGWKDGFFYDLVTDAHKAGERPTAAFPSSHVGVTMIVALLAWHSKNRKLFFTVLPFLILMCFSTVYIQAHYAIDVFAGLITGIIMYAALIRVKIKAK